jgi:hypothetical protein
VEDLWQSLATLGAKFCSVQQHEFGARFGCVRFLSQRTNQEDADRMTAFGEALLSYHANYGSRTFMLENRHTTAAFIYRTSLRLISAKHLVRDIHRCVMWVLPSAAVAPDTIFSITRLFVD